MNNGTKRRNQAASHRWNKRDEQQCGETHYTDNGPVKLSPVEQNKKFIFVHLPSPNKSLHINRYKSMTRSDEVFLKFSGCPTS